MDRERSPRATGAWWIEYVCRNKGAKWLKPSLEHGDVSFLQRHHLDLFIFLSTVAILSAFCILGYIKPRGKLPKLFPYLQE